MRPTLRFRHAAALLLCAAGLAMAMQTDEVDDDDPVGALVGEMMFGADLLLSLDALCPSGGATTDWHAVLPALPPDATTPELLQLSRRLAADAGRQLVQDSGGCASGEFAAAYDESRQNLGELIERWRKL